MLIDDVKAAYRAVARGTLTDAEANAIVAQIATDALTLDSYIADLTKQAASTTSAAIAIASFITGVSPTSEKLDALKIEADKQVASYTKMGVGNPALGAFEAFGKGFSEDPSTGFATKYGAMSDSEFINAVYAAVYGGLPSDGAFQNLASQIASFTKLYSDAGLANAALLAKGAALGQIVGYAFVDPVAAEKSKLDDQVNKLLASAAKGDATVFGKALPSLDPPPTTGGGGGTPIDPSRSFTLTDQQDKFTGGSGDDTFNAPGDIVTTFTNDDALDGGGGTDTLTINVDLVYGRNTAFPANATVKNIEIVEIVDGGAASPNLLDPSPYVGLTELWQTNWATILLDWRGDVLAGYRNTRQDVVILAALDAPSIAIALDRAKTISNIQRISIAGDALSDIKLSGSLVDDVPNDVITPATLVLASIGIDVATVRLDTNIATAIALSQNGFSTTPISNFDASKSAGAIYYESTPQVEIVTTGSGADRIKFGAGLGNPTLNAGLGADTITIETNGGGATTINAGGGDDSLTLLKRSAGALTIDMGDGDDSLLIAASSFNGLQAGDLIKGGAGYDTFRYSTGGWNGSDVTFESVERLIFDAAKNVNLSGSTGIKEIEANFNSGMLTLSGVSSDIAIHLAKDSLVSTDFSDKGALDNTTTLVSLGQAWEVRLPGVENVVLHVKDANYFGILTAPDMRTLTVKESQSEYMNFGAFSSLTKIDLSDVSRAQAQVSASTQSPDGLTVIGPQSASTKTYFNSSNAVTYRGGAGYDEVTVGAGSDINVGDGGSRIYNSKGDKVTFGEGIDRLFEPKSTISMMTEVFNFADSHDANGSDRVMFFATLNPLNADGQNAVSQLSASATLNDAVDAFFSAVNDASLWSGWFQFKGDTYAVRNDYGVSFNAAQDFIVKLIGLKELDGSTFSFI